MGIYGPGDPGRFLMLYRAVQRGRFLMFGDGETFYHPCYIDNLVDAFELAAEHPKAVGETYLIGDDRYVSLNELVTEVARSLGQPPADRPSPLRAALGRLRALRGGAHAPRDRAAAVPAASRLVPPDSRVHHRQGGAGAGFVARVPLAEGLRRTAIWYREHGYIR